ncbi:MAG: hypothetical protein WC748_00640 [Legionellales bacterium]|jgi:hypothetical protein
MSAQFKKDIDSLINKLNNALTAAEALLDKGDFYKKEFKSILSSYNLDHIKHSSINCQKEIDEYTSIIELLKCMQNDHEISRHDFYFLNQISYMQAFMQTYGDNIGISSRRNSI